MCDAIMGAGKTMAAITMMNEESRRPFLFLTRYLYEVDRIKTACSKKRFTDPWPTEGGKLATFTKLVEQGRNIVSTHALFHRYTDDVLRRLKEQGYILILDEVVDVLEVLGISESDVKLLLDANYIEVGKDNMVRWLCDGYSGVYNDARDKIANSYVTLEEDSKLMMWRMPIKMFEAFSDVYVLSYMFDVQLQSYMFQLHGVEREHIGVECRDGIYRYTDSPPPNKLWLPPVHILEDKRANAVGKKYHALSSNWFEQRSAKHEDVLALKRGLQSAFGYRFKAHNDNALWTTYVDHRGWLEIPGFKNGCFESWNCRGVNKWRDRTALAYCVNPFMKPDFKVYLARRGVKVDEEAWATSEMVQWLWRSALRDGKEVQLYIPSSRMRRLLKQWIAEVSL